MKLLIAGGTRFLGRHLAQQALQAGHQLTLLHRGRSGPDLFPDAEHRIADRDGDLSTLAHGSWDAAVDTSAFVPRQVRSLAAALDGRIGRYLLVSTISVYADLHAPGAGEDAPLRTLADPSTEQVGPDTYGGLKVLCEQAAQQAFAGRCLIARPGLLVGPHDPTGRFTWWVQRALRGGEMLAPGDPATPVQCIDARDAAAWLLLQAERATTGVFNLNGPAESTTMSGLLAAVLAGAPAPADPAALTWVDEAFLLANGVAPWTDLPVWLPSTQAAMHQRSIGRALAAGLRCRPLQQTVAETAAWLVEAARAQPTQPSAADAPPRAAIGLAPEREAALLAAWRAAVAR